MSLLRYESQVRAPLVDGTKDYHQVTEDICRPVENKPSRLWWIGFSISVALLLFGILSVAMEVTYGTGQWNLNRTIGWGWDITNFVWWVGIGHAGTLISVLSNKTIFTNRSIFFRQCLGLVSGLSKPGEVTSKVKGV